MRLLHEAESVFRNGYKGESCVIPLTHSGAHRYLIVIMPQPAIIYDGECRFCQWSVRRIRSLDRKDQFEYLPRQADGVDERFPILSQSDFNSGLRLIKEDEEVFVGADAVFEIYGSLPPYHLITWTYRIPILRQLFKAGYALIARNRHRFGRIECDTEACHLPAMTADHTPAASASQPPAPTAPTRSA